MAKKIKGPSYPNARFRLLPRNGPAAAPIAPEISIREMALVTFPE